MKEFSTAAKAAVEDDDAPAASIEFVVDGRPITAYRPSSGQMGVIVSRISAPTANDTESVAAFIDLFMAVLDHESRQHLTGRLMDREDDFELEQVATIMDYLFEEWTGRPLLEQSDSSPSPPPTGPRSTVKARRTTSSRSASAQIASAI